MSENKHSHLSQSRICCVCCYYLMSTLPEYLCGIKKSISQFCSHEENWFFNSNVFYSWPRQLCHQVAELLTLPPCTVSHLAGSGGGGSWFPLQLRQPPGSGCWPWAEKAPDPAAHRGVRLRWKGWGWAGSCLVPPRTSRHPQRWPVAGPPEETEKANGHVYSLYLVGWAEMFSNSIKLVKMSMLFSHFISSWFLLTFLWSEKSKCFVKLHVKTLFLTCWHRFIKLLLIKESNFAEICLAFLLSA